MVAYAISIVSGPPASPTFLTTSVQHKSQGQTLARVKVDLGKVFEKGDFRLSCPSFPTLKECDLQGRRTLPSAAPHISTASRS